MPAYHAPLHPLEKLAAIAMLLIALVAVITLTSCISVHRYNNSVVVNQPTSTGESRQTFDQSDAEQLSEGTGQEKELNDSLNPDISLP